MVSFLHLAECVLYVLKLFSVEAVVTGMFKILNAILFKFGYFNINNLKNNMIKIKFTTEHAY